VEQVVDRHRALFAHTLKTYQYVDALTRDELSVRYRLPGSTACAPAECARQLRDNEKAYDASVLLLAYGARASNQQANIVRRLKQTLLPFQARAYRYSEMKKNLMRFLALHGVGDEQTITLMIQMLGDLDPGDTTVQARRMLVAFYPDSVEPMRRAFADQTSLVQRRLLQALGEMPADAGIQAFLRERAADLPALRHAIEDALAAQTRG